MFSFFLIRNILFIFNYSAANDYFENVDLSKLKFRRAVSMLLNCTHQGALVLKIYRLYYDNTNLWFYNINKIFSEYNKC